LRCDGPFQGGAESLRWDAIAQAATAVLDLPAASAAPGAPDMPRWMPGRMEWLLVAPAAGRGRALMRRLPDGETRDAIVDGLRQRLGARWVGERVPLEQARRQFRLSGRGDTLKVVALVASVLAILFLMLMGAAVLASPVFSFPAIVVFGAWCLHCGLRGLRDALQITNMPTAKVVSAAMGLVELQGRAVTDCPVAAGASGRPSLWWDAAVDVWHAEKKGEGEWRQVLARHGGNADTVVLQDATGRVPVWLRDADLLLREHRWECGKDALPEAGRALLAAAGLRWDGSRRIRVRERRLEADGPLYVLGTLDDAGRLGATATADTGLAGRLRSLRSGAWRPALLQKLPMPVRAPMTVALLYLDMLFGLGRGGERPLRPGDAAAPPTLDAGALLVWKGTQGRPLIVADQPETQAVTQLRKRSLWFVAVGIGVLCWCLHELLKLF
jgi:hypothetical protein